MHKIVKILIMTSILCNIGFALFEPIYAIYVQEIGGYILEAAVAVGLFSIVLGVSTIIFGKITDSKTDLKKKLVVLGYSIVTISFLGYYFIRNPIDLFIVQIIMGLGTAMIDPGWDALFTRNVQKGKEATEWGIQEGCKQIAIGIAGITGGFVAYYFGFKILILTMFIFQVLATISVSRLLWTDGK